MGFGHFKCSGIFDFHWDFRSLYLDPIRLGFLGMGRRN